MLLSTKYSLTKKTKEKIFFQWLDMIKRRECGSVIHLPKRDQLYRAQAFLENKELMQKSIPDYGKHQFLTLDLAAYPLEDEIELTQFLKNKIDQNKRHHTLLVLDADELLQKKRYLLSLLDSLYRQKNISILYFFRTNITYSRLSTTISPFTTLYQNIFIFPFLNKEDSIHFVNYLEKKYEAEIPSALINQVVQFCAGIPVLIKQAFRYFSITKDQTHIFDHDEMRLKLMIVWDEFDDCEKKLLEKIVKKENILCEENQEILHYFCNTNTISKRKNEYCINSLLLENFIKTKLKNKFKIELSGQRDIIINGILMNNYFSKRERLFLIHLLKNKEHITSRDQTATIIWGNIFDQTYTDWSLDQFVSRLRKKLEGLGFEKDIIRTLKNQGFILHSYAATTP